MKSKGLKKIVFIFLFVFFVIIVFQTRIFQLKPKANITKLQDKELIELASKALESKDVPVGAILLYSNSIIGSGYNTVRRDTNISGHAEINAINDAVKKIGMEQFKALDRDKLILVSTFEPCEMCKGAILHYDIRKTYFMKDKSPMHWNKKQLKFLRYEWYKQKIRGEQKQDSLFQLHPEYSGRKYEYF